MLENHIIQARSQAAVSEKQAYERIEESAGVHQGLVEGENPLHALQWSTCMFAHIWFALFAVKSAFSWCVDNDLLKMNNLIVPLDYIPSQKSRREAPATSNWSSVGCIYIYWWYMIQYDESNCCFVIFPFSKSQSGQTNHHLRYARIQGAPGWWVYIDSKSGNESTSNQWPGFQPDPRIQLESRYPQKDDDSQAGEEPEAHNLWNNSVSYV